MRVRSTRQWSAPAPSSSRHARMRRAVFSAVSRRRSLSPKVRWSAHETLTMFMYPVASMRPRVLLALLLIAAAGRIGLAWDLPQDTGTLDRAAIVEILAGQQYPETSSYTQRVDFLDFTAHGQPFPRAVIPPPRDKPRLHNGRRLVVVGAEPG